MRTTSRRGASRLALALVIGVGTLGGAAVVSAPALAAPVAPGPAYLNRLVSALAGTPTTPARSASARAMAAVAPPCSRAPGPAACPTITKLTVGSAWIRKSTTTSITYPVTVLINDPANLAVGVITVMGRQLNREVPTTGAVLVGAGGGELALVPGSATQKTVTLIVESPYLPIGAFGDPTPPPAYGGFQINTVVLGADPNADPLVQSWRSGSIKARSTATNTPSASAVRKGHSFTEHGKLLRFDSTPQKRQKVKVYFVPAGQTRASYAGTATTSSTGAWSLPVHAWTTGSWFVNYPGSAFSTSVYKASWVRVS